MKSYIENKYAFRIYNRINYNSGWIISWKKKTISVKLCADNIASILEMK